MNKDYWQNRYLDEQTGWDIGEASTPIRAYFDAVTNKKANILIPGCGNAHEAAHLWQSGFENVYLCDWAAAPLKQFANTYPDFPKAQLLEADFFELEGQYDYIVEQTFFCALPPERRADYAQKMPTLLAPNGKLVGLLFGIDFERVGPPFGGNRQEYLTLFEPLFSSVQIAPCHNSIPPRQGSELFIELEK